MPDAPWKIKKDLVAMKVGGIRYGIQLPGHVDIFSAGLALMVVMRKKIPRVEADALNCARRAAGGSKLGGVVRTLTGSDAMYITFALDDFCAWYIHTVKEEVTA